MANSFIAEIQIFAGNFAPQGWANTDGQVVAISQYDSVFTLIGTTYGGDGQTTFALPNLQSRMPLHMGAASGLSTRVIGQPGGAESVPLQVTNKVGGTGATARVGPPSLPTVSPYLALNFIICMDGLFPSRN